MRIQNHFSASSSSSSLLLGFLDVISCGFAAALILGLIFSLVQPHEVGRGAEAKPYRYFEFTVSGEASYKDRPYVSPQILYQLAPSDPIKRAELRLNLQTHHWEVGQTGFQVDFVGAVANEDRFLSVAQTGPGEASVAFGIIMSQLPQSAWVDVQLIYSSRSGYWEYQADALPSLVVTRTVFGGNALPTKKTAGPLKLGQITKF